MLLPFTKKELNDKDCILEYARAYRDLTDKTLNNGINQHKKAKQAFTHAKEDMLNIFDFDYRWDHYDDVMQHINMFFPGYKLRQYFHGSDDIGRFYIRHILDIARTFITFRDGDVAIRYWSKEDDPLMCGYSEYEKIDLWNNMTRTATTDLFVAASYINSNVGSDKMYNVPNLISMADMPLKRILKKGIAETHLHAKAGISYQDIWRFSLSETKKKETDTELWFCTFFRIAAAQYIKYETDRTFEEYIYSEYKKDSILGWLADYMNHAAGTPGTNTMNEFCLLINRSREERADNIDYNADYLFLDVYSDYKYRGTSADIFLYYHIIRKLVDNYDPFLCKYFMEYVRCKNAFFEDKIQKTVLGGLDYFQRLYNSATKINGDAGMRRQYFYSVFEEQCKTGNLEYLELKISPPVIKGFQSEELAVSGLMKKILNQIKSIIGAYQKYISSHTRTGADDRAGSSDSGFRYPRLGIVYHFIKQEDSDNFNGYNCSFSDRPDLPDCFDYNTLRKKNITFLKALRLLMNKYPILTDYIVGIDAASIENEAEPWVFAPVFRAARQSSNTVPYSFEKGGKIQTLGFTYHVGEDFRHIISGLRHIDEVLDHYDYRSGDRLGHAIALGIDIDVYTSNIGTVSIPIIEHLENLLWMWQYAKSGDFVNKPENLEFQIMETASQIYGKELDGIDVYTLWRVYQAKFDDLGKHELSNKCCEQIKDNEPKLLSKNSRWKFNELLSTFYCPCFYELYHRPVFISAKDNIPFYKELQKKLIHKVENMGIYVETNPSSNAVIGDINSILDHPILRLNSIVRSYSSGNNDSCVLTTINSDDPIVFSTNAENEISYMYYALLNANCSRESALDWIDKIRRHGLDSTFIKSEKNTSGMLTDFETILNIGEK